MNQLVLLPVLFAADHHAAARSRNHLMLRVSPNLKNGGQVALRLDDGGDLVSVPSPADETIADVDNPNSSLVGLLYRNERRNRDSAAGPWMFVACTRRVGLNGQTPMSPVAAIEPGDLLTIGERGWMVSTLWQPEPVDAPDELRKKPCPVCGGELGFAQVVQCACGRWSHLENPDNADDPNGLNCFLKAGQCSECGRRAALEPQIIPEVSRSMMSAEFDSEV